MRVGVGRIAAHSFAQPVDRRLRVVLLPVRVPEVEHVIGIGRVGFGRLVEVVRRQPLPRLGRRAAAQLHDAEIVQHRRRRRRVEQRLERRKRIVVLLELQLRQAGAEPRLARHG